MVAACEKKVAVYELRTALLSLSLVCKRALFGVGDQEPVPKLTKPSDSKAALHPSLRSSIHGVVDCLRLVATVGWPEEDDLDILGHVDYSVGRLGCGGIFC